MLGCSTMTSLLQLSGPAEHDDVARRRVGEPVADLVDQHPVVVATDAAVQRGLHRAGRDHVDLGQERLDQEGQHQRHHDEQRQLLPERGATAAPGAPAATRPWAAPAWRRVRPRRNHRPAAGAGRGARRRRRPASPRGSPRGRFRRSPAARWPRWSRGPALAPSRSRLIGPGRSGPGRRAGSPGSGFGRRAPGGAAGYRRLLGARRRPGTTGSRSGVPRPEVTRCPFGRLTGPAARPGAGRPGSAPGARHRVRDVAVAPAVGPRPSGGAGR